MSKGSRLNNDAFEGLSNFVGRFKINIIWCILRGDKNISRDAVEGSLVCPHPVSLVELRGKIVMFSEMRGVFMNVVTKCL